MRGKDSERHEIEMLEAVMGDQHGAGLFVRSEAIVFSQLGAINAFFSGLSADNNKMLTNKLKCLVLTLQGAFQNVLGFALLNCLPKKVGACKVYS